MKFDLDQFITDAQREEGEAGITISDLSQSLHTLVAMRGKMSVFEAMTTFLATERVVLAAVECGPWLFLWPNSFDPKAFDPSATFIEVDGE